MSSEITPSWTKNALNNVLPPSITAQDLAQANPDKVFPKKKQKLRQIRAGNFPDIYESVLQENGIPSDREIFPPGIESRARTIGEQIILTDTVCFMVANNWNSPEDVDEALLGGKKQSKKVITEAMAQIIDRDYGGNTPDVSFNLMLRDWTKAMDIIDAQREAPAETLPLPGLGLTDPIAMDNYLHGKELTLIRERFAIGWFHKAIRHGKDHKPGLYDVNKVTRLSPTVVINYKPARLSLSVQLGSISIDPSNPDILEATSLRVAHQNTSQIEQEARTRWIQTQTFAAEQLLIESISKGQRIGALTNRSKVASVNYILPEDNGTELPKVIFVDRAYDPQDQTLAETPYTFTDDERREFGDWLTEFGFGYYYHNGAVEYHLYELNNLRQQPWTVEYNA